jgi:hypothetical protein
VSPAACVEICNPPTGCRPRWEECDEATTRCDPPECGSGRCQLGQGCYDPATFEPAAGEASICTCLPRIADPASGEDLQEEVLQEDSCAPYGMVCGFDSARKSAALCRKPSAFEGCLPRAGCAEGLSCAATSAGGLCLQSCAEGKDCRDITTYCEIMDGHCWPNRCARPDLDPAERDRSFKPCDAAGKGDGTCLPFTATADAFLCVQAGTAPSRGACDPDADRTNPSGLCQVGERCDATEPDPLDVTRAKGICVAACDAGPDAAALCPDGQRCIEVFGTQDSAHRPLGRLGSCLLACDVLGTGGCPLQDTLGNAMGCRVDAAQSGGVCRSLLPGAGALGAACPPPALAAEHRLTCGDRLFCLQSSGAAGAAPQGLCVPYCDPRVCADPGATCPACPPIATTAPVCAPLQPAVAGTTFAVCRP